MHAPRSESRSPRGRGNFRGSGSGNNRGRGNRGGRGGNRNNHSSDHVAKNLSQALENDNSSGGFMTSAQRAQRFGSTDKTQIYQQMKTMRVTERAEAIKAGLIPDPNKPMRLEDAIDFRGTCELMCPQFELVEREVQNMLDPLELDESGQGADPGRAVKRYRRSAAGNEQPLPSDVRPPYVLKLTLDYLFNTILMQYPLITCHGFLWDRTRGIRQDFTLQNIRDETAVELHERIARFHILSLHELSDADDERFSGQQETEQLRKVLLSLMEFYDDLREQDIEMQNEAEFRAYYMISHIHDHEVARQMMRLPGRVLRHPLLQRALQFYELVQRNNEIMETSERRNKFPNVEASQNLYSKVFKLVGAPDTPFLLASMVEWIFPDIRKGALKAMNKAYNFHHRGVEVEYLRQVLGYDSVKQLLSDAQGYGLVFEVTPTQTTIKFGQRTKTKRAFFVEPLSNPRPTKSMLLVDPKKGNRTLQQIVDGEGGEPYISTTQNIYQTLPSELPANGGPVLNQFQQDQQRVPSPPMRRPQFNAQLQSNAQRLQAIEEQKDRLQEHIRELEARKQGQRLRQQQEERRKAEEEARMKERQRQEDMIREEQEREAAARRAREEQIERERNLATLREQGLESVRLHKRKRREEVIGSLSDVLTEEVLEAVLAEKARLAAFKTAQTMRLIRRRFVPLIARARQQLEERKRRARDENSVFALMKNLLTFPHNSEEEKEESTRKSRSQAVKECLFAEGKALRLAKLRGTEPLHVWDAEDFAPLLHRHLVRGTQRIRASTKKSWHLYIHLEEDSPESIRWFKHKFGLDDEFMRRIERVGPLEIGIRAIYPDLPLHSEAVDHTGAIIFCLSEHRTTTDGDDEFDFGFWHQQKCHLDKFTARLLQERRSFKAPFLIMYWPRTADLKRVTEKIPDFLGLDANPVVTKYHFILMNPYTIYERLNEEIGWMARNTTMPVC